MKEDMSLQLDTIADRPDVDHQPSYNLFVDYMASYLPIILEKVEKLAVEEGNESEDSRNVCPHTVWRIILMVVGPAGG
jgi:hypothetical protein